MSAAPTSSTETTRHGTCCGQFWRHHRIDRQYDLAAERSCLGENIACCLDKVVLAKRSADGLALRDKKRIGHGAADDQRLDFRKQIAEKIELGRNLGAADDRRHRVLRRARKPSRSASSSAVMARPGYAGKFETVTMEVFEACSRWAAEKASSTKMSPSAASCFANPLSFFSSSGWNRVFSRQRMSPFFIAAIAASAFGPTQSSAKATGVFTDPRDLGGDRPQRILRIGSLGPAEMRQQNDLAALAGEFGDGRCDFLDAGCIRDLAVLHRHVEVDAHQHAFTFYVGVVEAAEGRHGTAPAENAEVRRACPSPPRCRPCDWRSPTHCRTTTSRGPTCRPSPWSGPCGRPRNADRD